MGARWRIALGASTVLAYGPSVRASDGSKWLLVVAEDGSVQATFRETLSPACAWGICANPRMCQLAALEMFADCAVPDLCGVNESCDPNDDSLHPRLVEGVEMSASCP